MGEQTIRAEVVVIGAGVIGLCCAYALRKRGLEVVVLDRAVPGSGASHGNGGWVCPSFSDPVPAPGLLTTSLRWLLQPDSPLYIRPRLDPAFARWLWRFQRACNPRDYHRGLAALAALNRRTLALYDALAADGVCFEQHKDGLLFLFVTEAAAERQAHDLALMERYGAPPAVPMSRADLAAEGLNPTERVIGGLLAPAERHVRPESLLAGLARWLDEAGVRLCNGHGVTGFERRGERIGGVRTTRGMVEARHIVLAAGVWSARLARELAMDLPLEAGKGYSVTMTGSPLHLSRPLDLSEARAALSPYDGALRVLGTMELSGLTHALTRRRLDALTAAPRAYLRDWTVTAVREEWAGPRPMTPDGLPVIGPAPTARNVIIATGHAMLGVTLAPATADVVADLIAGQPDHELLAPFRADRF